MQKKVLLTVSLLIVALSSWSMRSRLERLLRTKSTAESKSEARVSTLSVQSPILDNLSLHLDDVEFLRNAFIVQSLSGPLVRFSNRGRYEPYVAQSWSQDGNDWIFRLHEGLACEDGEKITPESFKLSLERSLRAFNPQDLSQTPFQQLDRFETTGDSIVLKFKQPMGKAVLEYLAMTPFSYLCSANFDGDRWRSRERFISAGPYRVSEFGPRACVLELRPEWSLAPAGAAKRVRIARDEDPNWPATARLQMSYAQPRNVPSTDRLVFEVPRALISVRLGIEKDQYFADRAHRRALKGVLDEVADKTEIPFENYHRAHSFFFGQMTGHEAVPGAPKVPPPTKPLRVRVFAGNTSIDEFYFDTLRKALDRLGWPYEFMTTAVKSVQEFYKQDYDISFDRSHVDATLDPDFVRILFKSKLGPRYQDPGLRISNLVDQFDAGKVAYRDFLITFNATLAEEAAVIPLFHRGFTFRFSPNVDVSSISPLMSIVRFEELLIDGT